MGVPNALDLEGKISRTKTIFTNTNCDTTGNLIYN